MTEHRTPLHAGSSGMDSPSQAGWGIAASLGYLGGAEMELSDIERHCESPIEVRLAQAIAVAFSGGVKAVGVNLVAAEPMDFDRWSTELPHVATIIPQAVVSDGCDWTYRVDFLIVCGGDPIHREAFAIESDGHDWHEKTKEQAARDKLRDRRLLAEGIATVRFAGSEIHADAAACAAFLVKLTHCATGNVISSEIDWETIKSLGNIKGFQG